MKASLLRAHSRVFNTNCPIIMERLQVTTLTSNVRLIDGSGGTIRLVISEVGAMATWTAGNWSAGPVYCTLAASIEDGGPKCLLRAPSRRVQREIKKKAEQRREFGGEMCRQPLAITRATGCGEEIDESCDQVSSRHGDPVRGDRPAMNRSRTSGACWSTACTWRGQRARGSPP